MWKLLHIKTLDRYIIRKFLSTVFFSMLICTLISMAIDFSDKVQNFIEKPATLQNILLDYYLGFVLHMAGLLMPLYTLIGVVFFTSRMAFNAEILSVLNAGVSFNRLLKPYLIAGGLVGLLHYALNNQLIPERNKLRLWFERSFVWTDQEKGKSSQVHFLTGPDTKVFIQNYNKSSKSATGLRLEKFDGNRVISLLEAQNATWKADPNIWEIRNYSVRTFDGLKEYYQYYPTPRDTAINLNPQDFIWYHHQNEELPSSELREVIDRDRRRGLSNVKSYEIELLRRTADAFTNVILTVIGLAVAGRKVRGGMGLHLALGIGIGALFILSSKFAVSFASSGSVPVALGMWLPNIVFAAVAVWLVSRAQK
ncbi:MAG: LptF/LptG family permease [Saprospiraceae bacterium]|nr:LptF/LptG family permease [Saprospiraceae bacterium]